MIKRLGICLIAVLLTFTDLGGRVFAENEPIVTVDCVQGKSGDKVCVPITLSGNTGFGTLALEIKYDNEALKLYDIDGGNNIGCNFTPAQNLSANPFNINWDDTKNNEYNGVLLNLCFEIITDVSGIYPLEISFYKGRNNVDGVDVNYAYGGRDLMDFIPLNLKYRSGYVQVGNMISDAISVNVILNGKTYTKELVPNYKSNGIIAAMLYDKNECLIGMKICDAKAVTNISFDENSAASRCKIIMWGNMINLRPLCQPQTIQLL